MSLAEEQIVRSPFPMCRCPTHQVHDYTLCLANEFQKLKIEDDFFQFRHKLLQNLRVPGIARVTFLVEIRSRFFDESDVADLISHLFHVAACESDIKYEFAAAMVSLSRRNFHLMPGQSIHDWIPSWFDCIRSKFHFSVALFTD